MNFGKLFCRQSAFAFGRRNGAPNLAVALNRPQSFLIDGGSYRFNSPYCALFISANRCFTNSSMMCNQQGTEEDREAVSGEAPSNEEIERLGAENKKLQAAVQELTDKFKRALAETENVRTRMQRQIDDAKQFGVQSLCKDLIQVADVIDIACQSIPADIGQTDSTDKSQYLKSMRDGLTLTQTQLLKTFRSHGLTQINPLGEKFNPLLHEAVFQVEDPEKEPGTVSVVTKIGYQLHQRVIRAAVVGVVKDK